MLRPASILGFFHKSGAAFRSAGVLDGSFDSVFAVAFFSVAISIQARSRAISVALFVRSNSFRANHRHFLTGISYSEFPPSIKVPRG